MKINRLRLAAGCLIAFAIGLQRVSAQAKTESSPSSKEEVLKLSPFEVTESNRGYYAPNVTSGTRLNSKLEDLAASITVVTKEQMADFAMLDINDIFLYEASTEGTGTYTEFAFDRNGYPVDNTSVEPNTSNRMRGIASANIARGNFETSGRVPLDPINIDAVEISRGPNASIIGLGTAGGTVNMVASTANLSRNFSQVQFRGDSFDGYRSSLDLSRVLLKDRLAVRGSAVYQHTGYERKPSGTDTVRLNGMVKFRPFKNTTLTAAFESYRIAGNMPNQTLPRDTLSAWKAAGMPTYNNKTRQMRINGALTGPALGITTLPTYLINTTGTGRTNSLMLVNNDGNVTWWGQPEGTVTLAPVGNPGARNQAFVGGQANTNAPIELYVPNISVGTFSDLSLTDRSVYDWSSINLAAMNYLRESTKTTTFGLEQLFLNSERQTIGLQIGFFREDSQKYRRDLNGAPTSQRQVGALYVDVNEFLPDGSANPNLMRPYIGLWTPRVYDAPIRREISRAQLAYRLDLRREKSLLRWLGQHQLAGYMEYKDLQSRRLEYKDALVSSNSFITPALNVRGSTAGSITNEYIRFYVGDNAGQNVDYGPASIRMGNYPYRWGTTEALSTTGAVTTPANIITENATIGPAVSGGGGNSNSRQVLKTQGAILQSYLINDRIVTTFGVRKDERYNRGGLSNVYLPDGANIDMTRFSQWAPGDWNYAKGTTKTAGVVVKAVRWLSFHADTSNSFQPAAAAINLFLKPVADPTGKQNEYGLSLNLFDGKLVARINHYKNTSINSRNGDANTIGGRANQIDFFSANIAATPFALGVQAQGWVTRANPTWTKDQVFAEVVRITKLDAAYFDPSDLSFNGNLAQAQDVVSKGQEFQLYFTPSKFWTTTFNVTRQETLNGQMFDDITNYLTARLPVWESIIDPETGLRWWDSPLGYDASRRNARDFYTASVLAPLQLAQAMRGKSRPQIRKYNWRMGTNYKLAGMTQQRILKNFQVGGGLRWEDKGSIGFYNRDPALVAANQSLSLLDPNRPIYDKAHLYADANLTYRTRLFSNRTGATFQLNVRNVFENGRLQPISANSDGRPNTYRIVDPQQFILSATFDL